MADGKKPRTSAEVKNRYNAKAYDRINLAVPKGYKERIKSAAGLRDEGKINTFIIRVVKAELEKIEKGL